MRNRTVTMFMAAAGLLVLAGTATAGERMRVERSNTTVTSATTDPRYDAALLEDERQELAWEAQNTKGIEKAELKSEEARVQDMIDGLQRGERVDPEAVDRVLNRTY